MQFDKKKNEAEVQFKRENRPSSCTEPPWAQLIPPAQRPGTLRQIRQECIDELGYSLDECPHRLTCLKKTCPGRPMPTFSKTAQPYLGTLKQRHKWDGDKFIVLTDCRECPIVKECKNPCNMVVDFIDRAKTKEPRLVFAESVDPMIPVDFPEIGDGKITAYAEELPWDCLSKKKVALIKLYLYEQRDYRYVADKLKLTNQARAKYEFYAALTKMSEYGVVRRFLTEHINKLTPRQQQIFDMIYYDNLTMVETARRLGISKQSVNQTVTRVLKRYGVKWPVFVRKHKKKTIYNVLEVFK